MIHQEREREAEHINFSIDEVAIKEHYQRCKLVILSYCKEDEAFRALIGNHNHWWNIDKERGTAKLFYPDGTDYNHLTSRYRTLYWTAQYFTNVTANIEKPFNFEKGRITEQIGGREDTVYYSFFLDLDKAKDKDIHDPGVIEWLEKAIKFFGDTLLNAGVKSFGLAFSGGGVYCVLHPRLGLIDRKDEKNYAYRVEIWQRAFDLFIGDTAAEFFKQYPEAIEWVKFDKLNNDSKRQVKTILSIHKKYPYAVIPLDKHNPKIDLKEASLPISDETIEKAKNWLVYQDDIDPFGNLLSPWTAKAQAKVKRTHGVRTVVIEKKEVGEEDWAPCIRNILTKKDLKSGEGASRALSVLASYLRYVGVPEEKAFRIFQQKANEWNAETSNLFESWYGSEPPKCIVPSCEKVRTKGSGYPHPELGDLNICTPDERCNEIRSPIYYHKTPEKRLNELIEAIEKEVGVEINDTYKMVLEDTTIEKYLDKETNKDKIQIKEPERKESYVLYCVPKSISPNQDNATFDVWSKLEPWNEPPKRNEIAIKLVDYDVIHDAKTTEAKRKARIIVDTVYRELRKKRKAQHEALIEYFELIKKLQENKQSYSEIERKKALELLNDPLLMPIIKNVLDFKFAGFGKKKLEFFCNLLSKDLAPKRRVSAVIHGKWGEGKSVLTEQVISFFDFERMNSATPQSVYRRAQIDEEYFNNKIVYFGDVGEGASEELKVVLDIFKQLISEGEVVRDINLKVGDDYVPVPLKLRGYPILVWTAQTPPSDSQHLSRIMPYNIDVSKEQRERVRTFSGFEEDTPEELRYPSEIKALEKTIKTALEIIKDERKPILNPFANLVNSCMSIDSPNVNRDRSKFFGLIAAITHLYQFQRDTIEIYDKKYLIVHPIDVLYALYLAEEDFRVLFGSLDAIAQRAYNLIKEKRKPIASLSSLKMRTHDTEDKDDKRAALDELEIKAFGNSDLEDWLNVSYKTAARITRNLFKKGILERDKKGREYRFYLITEGSKTKTNGNVLFDSRRMLEGLMDESIITEWLDRTISPYPPNVYVKNYFFTKDDFGRLSVPDSKIKIKNTHVYWGERENEESEEPQTFKYLTEDGNYLRDSGRTLEESLDEDMEIEEDAKAKERKRIQKINEETKEERQPKKQKPVIELNLKDDRKKINKIIGTGSDEIPKERKPVEIANDIADEKGQCQICGYGEKWGIKLPYLIFYSKTDNSDFKTVCKRCGERIMRDYNLKIIGGGEQ